LGEHSEVITPDELILSLIDGNFLLLSGARSGVKVGILSFRENELLQRLQCSY